MNKELKKLLTIDLNFRIVFGFLLFINLKVWEKSESMSIFMFYLMMYFVFRFISYNIGTFFVLKSKIVFVIRLSFLFVIFQFLHFLFLAEYIKNDYLYVASVAFFLAFFQSFYAIGFNQLVAHYGKEKEYTNFFAYRTYITSLTSFTVPLICGLFVFVLSFKAVVGVLAFISVINFLISLKIKPVKLDFKKEKSFFSDLLKKDKKNKIPKKIMLIHAFYIFIGGFVFQYTDTFKNIFTFSITSNSIYVALLNTLYLLVASLALFIFKKGEKISETTWFTVAGFTLTTPIVLSFAQNTSLYIVICLFFSFSLFFYNTFYNAISFKLIDDLSNYKKFLVLYKREMISIFGKISFTLLSFLYTIEKTTDKNYLWISFLTIVLIAVMVLLYREIQLFLKQKVYK